MSLSMTLSVDTPPSTPHTHKPRASISCDASGPSRAGHGPRSGPSRCWSLTKSPPTSLRLSARPTNTSPPNSPQTNSPRRPCAFVEAHRGFPEHLPSSKKLTSTPSPTCATWKSHGPPLGLLSDPDTRGANHCSGKWAAHPHHSREHSCSLATPPSRRLAPPPAAFPSSSRASTATALATSGLGG